MSHCAEFWVGDVAEIDVTGARSGADQCSFGAASCLPGGDPSKWKTAARVLPRRRSTSPARSSAPGFDHATKAGRAAMRLRTARAFASRRTESVPRP